VVPALRPSEAVDRRPLLSPPAVRGAGGALGDQGSTGRDVPAAAGFGVLALVGLAGLVRGARAR
jgi:hypothetical protein